MYAALTNSIQGKHQRNEFAIFLALASATLWLFNRPYTGIWHDAIIYSLLAARWLKPEHFVRELFFLFGSQDDFNLFTPAWGWLISWVGLDLANRMVVLFGGGMWCFAFAVLGRVFFGYTLPMAFVVVFAATLSWSYSPNGATFVLNETFATARVIAIPLALMGIAAELAGLRWLGIVLCVMASALHPLLGVWALLLVLCRTWPKMLLVAGAVAVFVLVFAIGPLTNIESLQPMAYEWMNTVRHSSSDVFVNPSIDFSFGKPLFWVISLWLGGQFGQKRFGDIYTVAALISVSAYLLALLCSNFYPAVLAVQAQPWRVLWLTICLGLFAVVDVVWLGVQKGTFGRIAVAGVLLLVYAFSRYAAIVVFVLCVLSNYSRKSVEQSVLRFLMSHACLLKIVMCLAALMLFPSFLLDVEMSWAGVLGQRGLVGNDLIWGFLIAGGNGLGCAFLGAVAMHPTSRRVGIAVLLGAFVFAWNGWDRRTEKRIEAERAYVPGAPTLFSSTPIRSGEVVVWPRHEMDVWFSLGAANYASATQAIGIVFSEAKTREVERRLKRLAAASMMDAAVTYDGQNLAHLEYQKKTAENGQDVGNVRNYVPVKIGLEGARYLCNDRIVDWVVVDPGKALLPEQGAVREVVVAGEVLGFMRCVDAIWNE